MFWNIFVLILCGGVVRRLRDSFVLTGECFVCEQKESFAISKNSYRLFACLFSLSIKIFLVVAGLSKAKMS